MIRILQFPNPWIVLFLALAIAQAIPFRVAAQSPIPNNQSLPTNWGAYEPDRNIGSPGRREGGGTRGPCIQNNSVNTQVMALVPANGFGTTTAEYPTFSAYLPPLLPESNPEIEFVLKTAEKKEVYKTKFKINRGAGIISFSLPNTGNLPALELNKIYFWSVTLICNPEAVDSGDVSGNKVVLGVIQRVTPNANVQQELATAKSLLDRVTIYAKAGIWYDALSNLAELRRRNPNDPIVVKDWQELLKSVDLEKLAQEPLFQPVVVRNQLNSSVSSVSGLLN